MTGRDTPLARIRLSRQVLTTLAEGAAREWLVADGRGGFAMGTVSGLRTRRYHGLLVAATAPPIGRHLALASLDPVLVLGDRRVRLAAHEWADGTVAPDGYAHLVDFEIRDGVPRWRWQVGDVVLERELAMERGRPVVAIHHRLLAAPGPVQLELEALSTWRDVHGERHGDGDPDVRLTADGYVFEDAYRVRGPGFRPTGGWYRGVRHRLEAERGLADQEDLWFAGTFRAELQPGGGVGVVAWAADLDDPPAPADVVIDRARVATRAVIRQASPDDDVDRVLAVAADQFIVSGPTVVAGYPWFGDWSRDTMTSYEGLFLATGRAEEGRRLLQAAAASLSAGMLANTADVGGTEYNTVDATLWFVHALGRHVETTGDDDLAVEMLPVLREIAKHHVEGTRYGIQVDPADGLLRQGEPGYALTWMDARVDGVPITGRHGKPVEINGLWIEALAVATGLARRVGADPGELDRLESAARRGFARRFTVVDASLPDLVDGPAGDDRAVRPNQLLALSLPHAPVADAAVVRRVAQDLLTPLGLRSLAPGEPGYLARHRGGPAERDRAYHQGTVWPWLIGPFVDAALRTGVPVTGVLDGLVDHLGDWGIGSVSETLDADPPHAATGCPFQAWSVAELIRARARLAAGAAA